MAWHCGSREQLGPNFLLLQEQMAPEMLVRNSTFSCPQMIPDLLLLPGITINGAKAVQTASDINSPITTTSQV